MDLDQKKLEQIMDSFQEEPKVDLQKDAEMYVKKYNESLPNMPLSYCLYRELLGLMWFVIMNRRTREIFKRYIDFIDKNEVATYTDLLAMLDKASLQSEFDEDEISEYFELKLKDNE